MHDLQHRLANVILDWHRRFGIEAAPGRMDREVLKKYKHTLADFAERWATDEAVPQEVAKCQVSGIFEYFYSDVVPRGMLREAQLEETFPPGSEVALYELAKRIQHPKTLREKQEISQSAERVFIFPEGWENHPYPLIAVSKRLPVHGRTLREVVMEECNYAFHELTQHGLGGQKVIASLHESAYRNQDLFHPENTSSVNIYSPGSFGLQLESGRGTAVSAIMGGRLRVANVLVGVESDWAVAHRKEG